MAILSTLDLTASHLKMLSAAVDTMRREVELTDVNIEVEDCHYRAHRVILCGASSYFRAMFNSGMQEAASGKITMNNISRSSLEVVLDYIYSGVLRMEDDTERIKSVLSLAHLLQMEPLYSYCFDLLCCEEKLTNCFADLWYLVELYDDKERYERIFNFVKNNFSKLMFKPEFLQLTVAQVKLLMLSPSLNCCTDVIVQGIVGWVEHKLPDRANFLLELLTLINLQHLSSEYLGVIQHHQLVKNDKDLLKLVLGVAVRKVEASSLQTFICFGRDQTDGGSSYVSTYIHYNKTWHTKVLPFVLRKGMATAYYNNRVYFVGGGKFYDEVFMYSHIHNTVQTVACVPVGRKYGGTAVLRNKLFLIGGEEWWGKHASSYVDYYSATSDSWKSVAPTVNLHFMPHVVQLMDNLVVLGSMSDACVELYDPDADQWSSLTKLPSVDNSFRCSAAVLHNQLYWMSESNILYVYNYFAENWKEVFISGEVGCDSEITADGQPFLLCADETGSLCKFYPKEKYKETLSKPPDLRCWFRWQTIVTNQLHT